MWNKILFNRAGQIALKSLFGFFILILVGAFSLMVLPALAWTEPSAAPPGGNVSAPINVSDVSQTKSGSLLIEGDSGATKGLRLGKGGLILAQGQNLIYGLINPSSDAAANILLFQLLGEDLFPTVFKVTKAGEMSINSVTASSVSSTTLCMSGDCRTSWPAGGSGSPGGSNTQVQFNDSSNFGGNSGLTYNKTTQILTATPASGGGVAESPLFVNTSSAATGGYISVQKNGTEKAEFGWGNLCGGSGDANAATICAANRIVQFGGGGYTDAILSGGNLGVGATSTAIYFQVGAYGGAMGVQNTATALLTTCPPGGGLKFQDDLSGSLAGIRSCNRNLELSSDSGTIKFGTVPGTPLMSLVSDKLGVGETSPGYQLDIRNATSTGTTMIRLNQDNPTAQYTGLRLDRRTAEKWYIGMNDVNSASDPINGDWLYFRRGGATNDLAINNAGRVIVTGSGLSVNGLTYTWPSSQSASTCLTNNGSGTLTWGSCGGGGSPHALLSATHNDTTAATPPMQGDLIRGAIGGQWETLPKGAIGQMLTIQGPDVVWSVPTYPNTYAANTILYASAPNTVGALIPLDSSVLIGGSGVSSGIPSFSTAIPQAVTIGGSYIYRAGGTDVAVADGGTGLSSYTTGDILYASGSGTLAGLADVATGSVLVSGGAGVAPSWSATPSVTSLTATGAIRSSGTAGVGYTTGAGGTVTQATSKSTGVTLNKTCGTITMNGAALAAATTVSFTLTNSTIAATDLVVVQHSSVGTLGAYNFAVTPAGGSASIAVRNVHTASLSEAIVLRFVVVKAVTN